MMKLLPGIPALALAMTRASFIHSQILAWPQNKGARLCPKSLLMPGLEAHMCGGGDKTGFCLAAPLTLICPTEP